MRRVQLIIEALGQKYSQVARAGLPLGTACVFMGLRVVRVVPGKPLSPLTIVSLHVHINLFYQKEPRSPRGDARSPWVAARP